MRVGFGKVAITPPLGISLAGFGARTSPARGVHDDLFTRAVVLDDGRTRSGLLVCDLCEIDAAFVAAVRDRVETAVGIAPDQLIVAATHTHAAPATFPLYSEPPDPRWLRGLADRVAGAVVAAVEDAGPATLSFGSGREETVARNRRRPDGPVDPTVSVVRADRSAGPAVLLVHYACHPTVLGPDNLLISRDFVGFAVDAVERATGGRAAFVNGACGDVNVGHSADRSALGLPLPGRTFERAEALGLRIAAAAVRASQDTRLLAPAAGKHATALAAARRAINVPLRATPPAAAARAHVEKRRQDLRRATAAGADPDVIAGAQLEVLYAEMALRWAEERPAAETERAEIQALAIGDLALVALPGEFFAESGLRLKAMSPFPQTLVVGYAGGGIGYVPPREAFAEGGYETRLAHWSRVAPETESLVLAAAAGLLEDLKRRQDAV
ncbi:MAG: neutral/alkaline non-lysosomal ceramidase N-terminal domain-containing protein [Armatimonadota bacterium]|nr:neutral/alkaline non-lysosomal ceramidase N-terminal domain-containing protein [Armatimonadota bacterium]